MPLAIETEKLTKCFRRLYSYRDLLRYAWQKPEFTAVDHISFGVEQGEVFGILGQNGAGKTTLIKMLSTALQPSSGRAMVAGYDVSQNVRAVRAAIGLVSGEERSFYWRLTGRQNLQFFASLYGLSKAEADRQIKRLIDAVGLRQFADKPFRTYSSGMRQKVAIARGLLHQPKIVFMDEPTRSLDPISSLQIREFVSNYITKELGCTVLLVTHAMDEAETLCDRLALIRHGKIVAQGSVAELCASQDVLRRITVRYLPEDLPAFLSQVPGIKHIQVMPQGQQSVLLVTMEARSDLFAWLMHELFLQGVEIHDCQTEQGKLETVYLRTLEQNAKSIPQALELR
jgi:ABC-2 type transport system ATP-binding protein